MKKLYIVLLSVILAALLGFGVVSLLDRGATVSASENRELAKKPELSAQSLLKGDYIPQFEEYYSDHFPLREQMLGVNRALNRFYYFSGSEEDNLLIIDGNSGAESGGQALSVQSSVPASAPQSIEPDPVKPEESKPAPEQPAADPPQEEQTPPVPPEEPENHASVPEESEASYAGNVVVVGTRAMEIPTSCDDIIVRYADAVDHLSEALGQDVRTISLVTPNGGEFYSPESMHTGLHSQKAMIELCYGSMNDDVLRVDAYSELEKHTGDYIYFRTDHHWTQLGAYHAYRKFCEAAGFDAVPLSDFESGSYENFVGSMYTFTSGYPQSQVLLDNPDTLTYYLPIRETHAMCYPDATLTNGYPVSVVYTGLDSATTNKYLCFIGGDTPVCVIESDAEGGVCMVLKESYGNAFVPFLTSHYSRIIVIDPREFNRDGKPTLDLRQFAKEQGVNDLLVINYPYMINSLNYVKWLDRLVGINE